MNRHTRQDAPVRPGPNPHHTRAALQDAIDAAAPGDELLLASGVYEIDAPLQINGSLTLRAADGGVVLSGGRRLSLDWQPHTIPGVMRAELPPALDLKAVAFDRLYIDGKPLRLARYPSFDPNQAVFGGTAEDALSPARIASWSDPAGGLIHCLHQARWGGDHWRISGKRADGTLDLEGGWMNNRPTGIHPTARFVENIFEELDAPGEWFLDRKARVLYVYPLEGMDLPSSEVVASGIERLIEVVGASPDEPAGGLRLIGVTLTHTARTFMKTREPLLRSDWMIHRGGAVLVENAQDVVLEGCVLRRLGGNGVFVSGHAQGITIRGCHFSDLGASGVCFVGKPEAVRSPAFRYEKFVEADEIDRAPGPQSEDYPRDCVVEDCLLHDLGTVEKQVAGVQISMAARITARHLSIYDVPRAGINIGDGTWGGHVIEGCDVFDTVQMTGDHGSFNAWGRDRFWHHEREVMDRLAQDHPELIGLDAVETTVIRDSRWRCDHGWDIDLDDGASNYAIYNNLCLSGGIKLREGFYRHVYNNVVVNNSLHPHAWFFESHDVFERNIVATWYRPLLLSTWGERVDHNLLPDATALQWSRQEGIDPHSAAGDPCFVAPAVGDFRVDDRSPALDLGFINFAMDQFGVRSSALRAVARTPEIPALQPPQDLNAGEAPPATFLGASVKQLQGEGERSATGIDRDRGVLILDIPGFARAGEVGLRSHDVILQVDATVTNCPEDLDAAYQAATGDRLTFVILRDQREQTVSVETTCGDGV